MKQPSQGEEKQWSGDSQTLVESWTQVFSFVEDLIATEKFLGLKRPPIPLPKSNRIE